MNTIGKNIGLFAAMVAMLGDTWPFVDEWHQKNSLRLEDIDVTPKEKPVPKGCKEYCFDMNGNYPNGRGEIYFKCIAMNEKSAIIKFEKWLKSKLVV